MLLWATPETRLGRVWTNIKPIWYPCWTPWDQPYHFHGRLDRARSRTVISIKHSPATNVSEGSYAMATKKGIIWRVLLICVTSYLSEMSLAQLYLRKKLKIYVELLLFERKLVYRGIQHGNRFDLIHSFFIYENRSRRNFTYSAWNSSCNIFNSAKIETMKESSSYNFSRWLRPYLTLSKFFINQLWRELSVIRYPLNNVNVRHKRDPLNRASPLFTCYRTAIIRAWCVSQRFDMLPGFFARANRGRGKRRRERGIGRRRIFWAWRYRFIGGPGTWNPLSHLSTTQHLSSFADQSLCGPHEDLLQNH